MCYERHPLIGDMVKHIVQTLQVIAQYLAIR